MKTIKPYKTKYILFMLILIFINGCGACRNPNYTTEITEILNPVAEIIEDFYTKNQRFPNIRERNKILEDRGCFFGDKGEGHCKKYGVWFEVSTSYDYSLYLQYRYVSCYINLSSDGKISYGKKPRCRDHCGGWRG